MKVYTRTGDKGDTSLFSGDRVQKTDARIQMLGEIDMLNSQIGVLVSLLEVKELMKYVPELKSIQELLFLSGSEIANPKLKVKSYYDFSNATQNLENQIDKMTVNLEELRNFILPGGDLTASHSHICRTFARSSERKFIEFRNQVKTSNSSFGVFLNRLSDYFFVLARQLNKDTGHTDVIWESQKII